MASRGSARPGPEAVAALDDLAAGSAEQAGGQAPQRAAAKRPPRKK
jgi:hypothetical protein